MSVLSTPLKNNIAMQKDIFRLAATLYSETSDLYSMFDTQLQIVKCMFVINDNQYMTYNEIIVNLLTTYKYHISEDEIITIIKRAKKNFQSSTIDDCEVFKLTDDEYRQTLDSQNRNIDSFIDAYIVQAGFEDSEKCKDAIHKYLYELTTTNINSYKILLFGKDGTYFFDKELSVSVDDLPADEKKIIHGFLEWDNDEKNIALSNIVFCCLEYCLLVNGDTPNNLLENYIKRREVYLDTNIIFRALGINGASRKKVVIAFLNKCKQAKLKLIISRNTKKEFFDTVTHYVSQISAYPRGKIFLGAYEQLSDYNIFSFYDDWYQDHAALSLRYFTIYIKSLYSGIVSQYNIVDDEKIPASIYDSTEFKDKRNAYSSSIKSKKQELKPYYIAEDDYYSLKDSHDATVVRFIELLREKHDDERDIFFISSDKLLRCWDMTRAERKFPVVVYPSQLFLILIKMCGRSDNDYESFVSFINIRTNTQQISPEKANIIISGISSITEDINAQKALVSAVYNDEFQNIIQNSNTDLELYHHVQELSECYLENELSERGTQLQAANDSLLQKEDLIGKLEAEAVDKEKNSREQEKQYQAKIKSLTNEKEIQKERVCKFAEQKIKPVYIWTWYILPVLIMIYTLSVVMFVGLQFFFCDASWNFAIKMLDFISSTVFGQKVNDSLAIIDAALFAPMIPIYPLLWKNPWNKSKKALDKEARIEKYIKDNKLI